MSLNRYIRFLVPFAALMLFMLSFLPHALVSGPQKNFLDIHIGYCEDNWWSALLMIQNYVNPHDVVSFFYQKFLLLIYKVFNFFFQFNIFIKLNIKTLITFTSVSYSHLVP